MKIKDSGKNLFSSFLFLVFGSLIFAYPDDVIIVASKILGIALLLFGLFMVVKNYYETKQDSNTPSTTLMFAIITIIIGILFIVLAASISQIVQYIIGAWILFNGLERLIIALSLSKNNNSFLTQIIVSVLLLAAGLYTILKSNLPLQIVGLVLIIYSILEIIGYFSNKFGSQNEISVKEQIENKAKVKDAKVIETKEKK